MGSTTRLAALSHDALSSRAFRLHPVAAGLLLALSQGHAVAQAEADATLPAVHVTGTRSSNTALSLDTPGATGSRLGLTARETPASVSRIDNAEIAERGISRLQDAVVRLPGMSSAAGAGNGGTAMTARGFSGPSSVVQMIDGTRLIVGAGTVSYPLSVWPIEAVEVLRGPSSVLYGDGAIGAAVNYITKRPVTDRRENEAFATAGTHDIQRAGIGSRGPINEQWAYSAYLDGDHNGGYIAKTDYTLLNYSAALQFRPDARWKFMLSADGGHDDGVRYRGTPVKNSALDPALRRTNFNAADSALEFTDRWWRFDTEFAPNGQVKLRNQAYYLTTYRHFRDVQNYAYTNAGLISRGRYVDILHNQSQVGDRFDASLDGTLAGLKNRATVGAEAYRVRFLHSNNADASGTGYPSSPVAVDPYAFVPDPFDSAPGSRATVPRARTRLSTVALFAEDALDLNSQLKLVAGLRKDHMDLSSADPQQGTNAANTYQPVTGRAGLVWSPSNTLSLYGQYATATDPTNSLLTLVTSTTPNFRLAKGRQVEVGAKGDLAVWRGEWTLAAYRIKKTDLLSIVNGVAQQVGSQSAQGVEAALTLEPLRGWTVGLNGAALRAKFDDFFENPGPVSRAGKVPPNVPQHMANLWTAWRFAPGWQVGGGAQYVGRRPGDNANLTWVPSYTLFDAALHWDATKALRLSLLGRNLADKAYGVTAANNGNQWLLGDPRTVELTAHLTF